MQKNIENTGLLPKETIFSLCMLALCMVILVVESNFVLFYTLNIFA